MRLSTGLNRLHLPEAHSQKGDKPLAIHPSPMERIGREGDLCLEYACRGERTLLVRYRFRNPLQVFPPIELDGGRCAYTQILNPCGGLVGGDCLKIKARLEKGAHVLFTTTSATRIYRSLDQTAIQTTHIEVGPDATLEWFPDTVIPYAGSKFKQQLHIRLDGESTVLLWDAYSSGRVARGERWAFTRLANEICVVMPNGRKVLERYDLDPSAINLTAPGSGEEWDYFASLYVISCRSIDWTALLNLLMSILDQCPTGAMGGISSLAIPGLALRIVAKTAVALTTVHAALWDTSRRFILGIPAPALRKY